MQFVSYSNSPQAYENLYRSNLLQDDAVNLDNNYIFTPLVGDDGYTARYKTHWNSKDKSDVFNFGDYLLDNHYRPMYYNGLIDSTSFLGNRHDNPYRTGEAQSFFFEGNKPPYSNNYGWFSEVGNWNPYISPKKSLENYIREKIIRNEDRKKMIENATDKNNLCYPLLADNIARERLQLFSNEYLVANGNNVPLNIIKSPSAPRLTPELTPQISSDLKKSGLLNVTSGNMNKVGKEGFDNMHNNNIGNMHSVNSPFHTINSPFHPLNPPIQRVNTPFHSLNPPIQHVNTPFHPLGPPMQHIQSPHGKLHPLVQPTPNGIAPDPSSLSSGSPGSPSGSSSQIGDPSDIPPASALASDNIDVGLQYPTLSKNYNDLFNMSIYQLANKTALVIMEIIGDLTKWIEDPTKNVGNLVHIISRPDRMPYVGILLIIIAIMWMIIF